MTRRNRPVETGRLITLEGGEGAGKSTQARFIADWLRARGRGVVQTREPGGSPLAEALRGVILQDWPGGISPETETLLMFAARAAHLEQTVRPALARGEDVVCDRFIDSTYAYQGAGKGVPRTRIAQMEKLVLAGLRPRLTLVLDLPPELGLQRARRRGDQNRFEAETLAFQRRVRRCFRERARAAPRRYAVIDASQPVEQVQAAVVRVLERCL